ncbi:MAG TPA: PhzF family phenazine biosynthesis isomerase, partial [Cytophagales bacterium]|nr:PhzF family phenazine biosynthesis isomerase [Cytophagales bacterium]
MKLYQVDAFTDVPFKGNPAGVHIGQDMLDAKFMQQIASEMNLAETAFVFNEASGYAIRFFTPTQEVPICGHATLSAAHIMYELGLVPLHQKISFSSKSGILSVQKQDHWYVLDFPKYESVQEGDHAAFSQDTGIESA